MYISTRASRSTLGPRGRRRGLSGLGDAVTDLLNNIPFVSDLNLTGDSPVDFDASTDPSVLTTSGGGSVSASDFNCTKVPGVCRPMNVPALNAVQALQMALDRVADVKGFSKIAVDGDIGPATVALLNQVAATSSSAPVSGGAVPSAPSPLALASMLDTVTTQANTYATGIGAPGTVSTPAAGKPATLATRSGQTMKAPAPNQAAAGGNLGALGTSLSTTSLMIGGGLIAAFMFLGKPKGARLSSKRRTTRRRRY